MERDPEHWLFKHTPREWIQAALSELRRAEEAYRANNARAGHAGARRAAGMALNAALIVEPDESWGRSFMDHIQALARASGAGERPVPEEVIESARVLLESPQPGGSVIALRSRSADERLLEAARTVMAHAYAVLARHEGASS